MRVPPGVSEKDFSDAIRQFEEVVGLDWVFTSDEDLDLYRDSYSPYQGEEEERVASAAVAPAKVEEVSKPSRTQWIRTGFFPQADTGFGPRT